MAARASSTPVECSKCFHTFKTRARPGTRIVCPMCESFFQVEDSQQVPEHAETQETDTGKETGPRPGTEVAAGGDGPSGETASPQGPGADEAGAAQRGPTDEAGDEGVDLDTGPADDESWTDEDEGDTEADWDEEADLPGDGDDRLPEAETPDGRGLSPTTAGAPGRSKAGTHAPRPGRREPENLADSALTLARDVTKPYRHTSLVQLARLPRTKVQFAAILLMVVFFLGLATTMTYAWRAYAWDDPAAGDGLNTLQLTVQNDTGTELKEAQVRIQALNIHAESNAHGLVVLRNLPSGDHVVLVSRDGFNPVRLMVTLRSSTDTQKTVSLVEGDGKQTVTVDEREATDMPGPGMLYLLAVIFLLGSLASFMAASFSFQRIRYRLSMGCAVAAVLSYGFLLGTLLALMALLLLILAPYEFEDQLTPDAVAGP